AAQAVERDLIVDDAGANQAKINAAATRLTAAIAGLTKLGNCDYAALDAALAAAAKADTTNCTSASVAEFNAALAAAQAVERNLIADEAGANQAKVNAAAARLNKAISDLTKLGNCDYADLDAAMAAYEAKLADKAIYANWAEYEAAYNAAKAIARDMVADEAGVNQKAIDDAAAVLNAVVLDYKAADYSAVEAAKAKIPADMSTALYTAASVKAVNDAVAAVVEGLDITKQAQVDAFAAAIEDAVANLVKLGKVDYSKLDAAINNVPADAQDSYSTATWNAYQEALAAAKAVERGMIADEAGVNQAKVNEAAKALADAFANLADKEFCDYSALEELLLYCSELDADEAYYDAADVAEWKAALAEAKALLAAEKLEKTDANQAIIDNAAAALAEEYDDLYEMYVDLADLAAAVENYGEHKIENEIERYTADSWAAYEAALEAAQEALVTYDVAPDTAEARAAVAKAAKDLEDAYNALELIKGYCDYEYLEEAVLYCSELDADEVYYDATKLAQWKAALAEAKALLEGEPLYLTPENQEMIDAAADALFEAYDDLYEIYVDLSDLAAAVENYGEHKIENEIERYTADSWAAYEAALAAAQEALVTYDVAPDTAEARAAVAKAAKDLEDAYNALELITGYCDYSMLEEAVLYCSELDADEAYYDAAELAQWKAALADAIALLEGDKLYLTPENQAIIDAAAEALINEYSDLYEMYVDLSDLAAAVENYGEHKVDNEIERYTADSWAAYEAALAAAQQALVDYDLAPDTDENAAAVAGLAKALEDAYKNLTVLGDCDYSELYEAMAEYEAKLADKDLYTNWAEYEAAYNAAQAVDSDMIADAAGANQAKIDAAADALNAVVLVYKTADYSAVEAAKATIPADLSIYTEDSVKAVTDAVAAVVEGLDITKQAEVDAMAKAIADAVAKLTVAEVPLVLKAKEGSTTIIDRENGFIYGLSCAGVDAYSEYEFVEDLLAQNFVEIEGDGRLEYTYVGNNTVLGTGAKVEFINNKTGEVVETFYIVIFGDIDGDGTVTLDDSSDAIDYFAWNDCNYDYEDFTVPAVFAADIDNDGMVTLNDFAISTDYLSWNSDFIPQVR
ncbi:MAG: FIVAR domain-containing protein, partial [Clostridia bacterium]|nr:FIVAR domain-containing protein [Clostridia bacterium]